MKNSYTASQTFIRDLLAGLTVSFAAISLGAAFGVMSGKGALAGMLGAAIIPVITSLFGGTRLQASGPTGPMTAVAALLIAKAHDTFPDPLMAGQFITFTVILSGVIMILLGILRAGHLIKYVPNAVVLGFMNGIAFLIWYDQAVKLFGWNEKAALGGGVLLNLTLIIGTLIFIFGLPALLKRAGIPAQVRIFFSPVLLSIIVASAFTVITGLPVQSVELGGSLGSFSEFIEFVKSGIPTSSMFTQEIFLLALPLAGQLALLGYLDSLLTSLVIDRLTGEKTKRNKELVAQGLSNSVSSIIGGLPGAQATIRSVLLLKEGAQTRAAGVMVGLFAFLFILFFGQWIALIPAAVFTAVLLKAGWDVCERDFVRAYVKGKWWKSYNRNFQALLILVTTVITVVFDLNVAVVAGTVLYYAGIYFMKIHNLRDVEDVLEENID